LTKLIELATMPQFHGRYLDRFLTKQEANLLGRT
jgi:hypothetical protein